MVKVTSKQQKSNLTLLMTEPNQQILKVKLSKREKQKKRREEKVNE